MFQQQVFLINMILMVVDALCVIAAGYGAVYLRSLESYGLWSMEDYVLASSVLLVMFVNNVAMDRVAGLYSDRRITSYYRLALAVLKAVVVDFALLASAVFVFQQKDYSRAFMLYFAGLTFVLLLIARSAANLYINVIARTDFNARKLMVVGDHQRAKVVVDALERQLSLGHQIAHHLSIEMEEDGHSSARKIKELPRLLREKEIDEVVFAVPGDRSIALGAYIDVCSKMGIPARVLPALWDPEKPSLRVDQCQGIPFLTVHVNSFNVTGLLYKRVLDLAGGLVGCVLLGIMYPFIAAAIKLESSGPVLFKQDRVGLNGRIFKVYKFRSMYVDAEERKAELMKANEMQGPMFKMKDDPRVTWVGKFLRGTSLDEFPQFLNVLKGEMSLVGTRPPTPAEVKKYELCHYKRISSKPGITGLWQVSGRNRITDFEEVVRLDCQYLENWRFWTDIRILFKTIWVVLARKGAC